MDGKPPLVVQDRPDTCALACLRMVLAHLGTTISEAKLVQLVLMEEGGVDIEELARAARQLGFRAKIQELSLTQIKALLARNVFPIVYLNRVHLERRFPVVRKVALRLFLPHAVVPVRISGSFVTFHDPRHKKPRRVSKKKFDAAQRDLRNWCVVCQSVAAPHE